MSLKKKIANCIGGSFVPDVFGKLFKGTKIVFYHGVVNDEVVDNYIQANQMCFNDFKRQIEFYEKNFEIVSIETFASRFESKSLAGNELVITFDDGYRNNLTIVAPYLKSKNIPFTVYVCPELSAQERRVPTYYIRLAVYQNKNTVLSIPSLDKVYEINTNAQKDLAHSDLIRIAKESDRQVVEGILEDVSNAFSKEELLCLNDKFESESLLTVQEIIELEKNYPCTIASHCLDHTILHDNQKNDEIDRQLVKSKRAIVDVLNKCEFFAFPNGSEKYVSKYAIERTAKEYRFGFAVNGSNVKYSDHKGYISRISVASNYNFFKIQLLMIPVLK